jgi:hypothetical protein
MARAGRGISPAGDHRGLFELIRVLMVYIYQDPDK